MSAYEVRRIDELDAIPVEEADITWRPIRRPLGIRAFGINAYSAEEGKQVVEDHNENYLRHEEVYVVVSGRARFTVGGDEFELDAGSFVYVRDPMTQRGAVALENGTAVLAIGGKPGEAYEPSAWETAFFAAPFRDRGEYEQALALVEADGAEVPDNPAFLYERASLETLLGRRDDAIAHLREALEIKPRFVRSVLLNEDFAALREDPEFLAITGKAQAADREP